MKQFTYSFIATIIFVWELSGQTYNPQRDKFFAASSFSSSYLGVYDFNKDGLDDILVGGDNRLSLNKTPIHLFINKGDGTFLDMTSIYVNGTLSAANPESVNGDFNSDGILDFAIFDRGHMERGQDPVATGYYGEDAILLLSNSNGRWDVSTALAQAHKNENPFGKSELHMKYGSAADINKDGWIDIFVESGGGYQQLLSHIYINNGNSGFTVGKMGQQIWNYPFSGPTGRWRQYANEFADVNNDGYPDLLVGQLRTFNNEQEDLSSFVLINNGEGKFLEKDAIALPRATWNEGYTNVRSILPIDLNQDGWLDLIFCQERGNRNIPNYSDANTGNYLQVYINNKGKEFFDRTSEYITVNEDILAANSPLYGKNYNSGKALLVDMNEDGFEDIFIARSSPVDNNNPLIFFNNGLNQFSPASQDIQLSITNGQSYFGEECYPIDLNGDGLMDIISADLKPGNDGVYNTGDEFHEFFPIISEADYPKVSGISIVSSDEYKDGLKITFIPNLGITNFYFEKIHGGKLFTADKSPVEAGSFIPRAIAEHGFLFTPDLDFQGNAFFHIQGSNGTAITSLLGSKFIAKIEVTCAEISPPNVNSEYFFCSDENIPPITLDTNEESFVWYSDNSMNQVLGTGKVFQPENSIGTKKYYVTRKLNYCESEPKEFTVTIFEKPKVEIVSSANSICRGQAVTLTATGGTTYNWDKGITNGKEFFPEKTETYTVTVIDENNCSNSLSITIEVKETPAKPVITLQQTPFTKLTSNYTTGNQWYRNNNMIPGATEAEYIPNESGLYSVQVTANQCTSEFSDQVEVLQIITSVHDKEESTRIWPNPVYNMLFVDGIPAEFTSYVIYSSSGQVIINGELTEHIDFSSFSPGTYFFKITGGNKSKIFKVLKL